MLSRRALLLHGHHTASCPLPFMGSSISSTSAAYDKDKAASLQRYFGLLQRQEDFHFLLEPIDNPDEPDDSGEKLPMLFYVLGGVKTTGKITLLNNTMICFVLNTRMKGYDPTTHSMWDVKFNFQPNSMMKFLHHIFACLKANGVALTQSDLRFGRGSYHELLANMWADAAKQRSEFGRLPFRVITALHDEQKMKHAEPKLRLQIEKGNENNNELRMAVFYMFSRDTSDRNGEVSCCVVDCLLLIVCPLTL